MTPTKRSVIFLATMSCWAQPAAVLPGRALDVIPPSRVPSTMQYRFRQMGERLQKAENSRVVYSGVLKDAAGERAIEIQLQNPGMVRIVEQSTPPRTISFNGTRVSSTGGAASAALEKLLEAVLLDSPEALFQQLAHGEAYQKLGGRFRLTNRPVPAAVEEYVDLYRMFPRGEGAKALANSGKVKMLGFDSTTGLPRFVSYAAGDGVAVSVEFEDWRTLGKERYPGLIRRRERGAEVFQIRVQSIQTGARAAAGIF